MTTITRKEYDPEGTEQVLGLPCKTVVEKWDGSIDSDGLHIDDAFGVEEIDIDDNHSDGIMALAAEIASVQMQERMMPYALTDIVATTANEEDNKECSIVSTRKVDDVLYISLSYDDGENIQFAGFKAKVLLDNRPKMYTDTSRHEVVVAQVPYEMARMLREKSIDITNGFDGFNKVVGFSGEEYGQFLKGASKYALYAIMAKKNMAAMFGLGCIRYTDALEGIFSEDYLEGHPDALMVVLKVVYSHPSLGQVIAENPALGQAIAEGVTGGIVPEALGGDPSVKVFGNVNLIDAIEVLSNTVVIDEVHNCYAILNKNDHNSFADGTTWSGSYGNSFRHTPKIYYKPSLDVDGFWQYEYSFLPLEGFDYSFEENFVGTYLAGFVNNALVSRPGVAPKNNTTMSQFWQYAQNVGSNYGLYDYHDWRKFVMMSYAKLKNRDAQTTIGFGLSNAGQNYYTATTGRTLSIGDGSGESQYDSTYKQVRVLGLEAPYGQMWQFAPGIRFSGSGATATVYDGNIVSNNASGRTFSKPNNYSQAYITKMQLGEHFDLIPIAAGSGSANTYYCDATWTSTSGELLRVGAHSIIGSSGGLAVTDSIFGFSGSGAAGGARLAFKGDIKGYTLVSGAEMARLNS